MKPTIVYVVPPGEGYNLDRLKFCSTYVANPPGIEHDSIVVFNGHAPTSLELALFHGSLQEVREHVHDNSGFDIGAFQAASRLKDSGMIVFFGTSAWFPRAGWLARMVEVFEKRGTNNLYGCHGNMGYMPHGVRPHVRTTGFWLDSAIFNQYPHHVTHQGQRYEFEHGATCLTQWFKDHGRPVYTAGFQGEFLQHEWDSMPNGYHSGDQSNLLIRDRMTEPPYYHATYSDFLSLSVPPPPPGQPAPPGGGNRF